MDVKKNLLIALSLLIACIMLSACSDDDGQENPGDDNADRIAYILYEGSYGYNNAGISRYDVSGKTALVDDIYLSVNGVNLGSLANDMLEYNDKLYVVVNGSKYVACLDSSAKELARFKFDDGEGSPRYITADDGYVYVTQYGGRVSKFDARTLARVAVFEGGDNLEGIAINDGYLYVSNAYKVTEAGYYVYNNEVFVIKASDMTLSNTITVVENPDRIYEIDDVVYLLSKGNYADVSSALQRYDVKQKKFEVITSADKIAEGNNGLIYGVRSAYDENWNLSNEFFVYNPSGAGTVTNKSFVNNAPSDFTSKAVYLLEVDDETGDIYVGISDYVNTGTMYRFNKNGDLTETFDAGGVNPKTMVFID